MALNWSTARQALMVGGLFALLWFSWASHSRTLFNGLATPLFLALTAYLLVLASQYPVAVAPRSLFLFSLFAGWAFFADARSGEFFPALAMDTHWFVLPLATLLMAGVFREFPIAFQVLRVGAALCIINLLLTMVVNAEWYDNWHYPPIFGHIRHLGLSVGFLTILLFVKTELGGWTAHFFRAVRILGLAMVFWSGTRASMLAWACCVAVFVYADRAWLKILMIDTFASLALALIPDPPMQNVGIGGAFRLSLGAKSMDELSSSRLAIWKSTLLGLDSIDRLWTGVGGNGYARLQVMHGVVVNYYRHVHAHSGAVQSICDWGIVGLTLLSGFFHQSTLRPIVSERKNNDPTAVAGVAYVLITGMLDATLFHLEHLIYLSIAIAWLISQKPERSGMKIVFPVPAAIALLIGLAFVHTQTFDYRIGLYWYFPTQ